MRRVLSFIQRRSWPLAAAAVVFNAFVGNATTPLWDQDEAAYAGMARHMVRSGDWVVPEFMWSAAHRKPPLLLWGMATATRLLGESELVLRLPTTLCVLSAFLSVWLLGRRVFGERRARVAALVLSTSLLLPNMGKVAFPDCWLLFAETVGPLALLLVLREGRWRWVLTFWGAVLLGALAKGPPILILTGGLVIWALVLDPNRETSRRRLVQLHPWVGLPVALAPLFVWGFIAWHRTDGALIRWMVDWYVVRRARGGTVFGQFGPPGYHLAVMFVGLLPWSALLPAVLAHWRMRWLEPDQRFLLGWLVFGWLVWEAMPSKLPAYAIGGYPPMALLIATELDTLDVPAWGSRSGRLGQWLALAVGLVGAAGLILAAMHLELGVAPAASAVLIALTAIGCAAAVRQPKPRREALQITSVFAATGLVVSAICWIGIMPSIDTLRGVGRSLEEAVEECAGPRSRVIYGGDYHLPSIPFYVGRTHADQLVEPAATIAEQLAARSMDVFILSPGDLSRIGPLVREIQVRRVDGWSLDHTRQETYYVVSRYSPSMGPS